MHKITAAKLCEIKGKGEDFNSLYSTTDLMKKN